MSSTVTASSMDLTSLALGILGGAGDALRPRAAVTPLRDAASRGVDALLRRQGVDGEWKDYELPQGQTDAWVTAYTGLALCRAAQRLGRPDAWDAARRAAAWLVAHRPYAAGWGYNSISGPDADSTAYAFMLFRALGHALDERDVEWLLRHWQPGGGFSTYLVTDPLGMGAWAKAHPDVTPTSFLALPADRAAPLTAELGRSLQRWRRPDLTWPAYWWRACHYSTYWNLQVLSSLGEQLPATPPVVTTEETRALHTYFDLAFVVGIAHLQRGATDLTLALATALTHGQMEDGRWPGGANLRVTNPACDEPWSVTKGRGKLYIDLEGLITTASAVMVLSDLLT